MKFACDRCRKRFSTVDEPVPGRTYRAPCRCGNTIVIRAGEAPAPVPPPIPRVPRREPGAPRTSPPPLPVAPMAAPARAAPLDVARANARAAAEAEVSALVDDAFARATAPVPDLRATASHDDVTPTLLAPLAAPRDPDAADVSSAYAAATAPDAFTDALRRTRTHALALGGATGAAIGAALALVAFALLLRPASPIASAAEARTDVAVAEPAPPSVPGRVATRKARSAGPSGAASPRPRLAGVAPAAATAAARTPDAPAPALLEAASTAAPRKVERAAEDPPSPVAPAEPAPSPGPAAADDASPEEAARAPDAQAEAAAPVEPAAAEPVAVGGPAPRSEPATEERGAPEPAAPAQDSVDATAAADADADADPR